MRAHERESQARMIEVGADPGWTPALGAVAFGAGQMEGPVRAGRRVLGVSSPGEPDHQPQQESEARSKVPPRDVPE